MNFVLNLVQIGLDVLILAAVVASGVSFKKIRDQLQNWVGKN